MARFGLPLVATLVIRAVALPDHCTGVYNDTCADEGAGDSDGSLFQQSKSTGGVVAATHEAVVTSIQGLQSSQAGVLQSMKGWVLITVATAILGCTLVALITGFLGQNIGQQLGSAKSAEEVTAYRWALILMSGVVQLFAGSVYAMGAWQDELRDALGVSVTSISAIGAATFLGSVAAMGGGYVFDKLGPRASVALGGTMCTIGYLLICIAIVGSKILPTVTKTVLAALGSMMAGYSSVSLLDNVVCMACSLSFPTDKAAVVGYLKAVLATAAGLWALLWVHVFKAPHGSGLLAYLGFTAAVCFGCTIFCCYWTVVLPDGACRESLGSTDFRRLAVAILLVVGLSVFDVIVSFLFSRSIIEPTSRLGYIGISLALLPLAILMFSRSATRTELPVDTEPLKTIAANAAAVKAVDGVYFSSAVRGLDFWLAWYLQFAIFGSGVALNQNLALILESAGSPSASGLGVALFALTSSLSRVVVGILSDKYSHVISRFRWMVLVAVCAVVSQMLVSSMSFAGIMLGVLFMGLAFGAFFTIIVPLVNEMYGRKQFGVIMGSQLASQALSAALISLNLLPIVYSRASHGESVCIGAQCYRLSFVLLSIVQVGAFFASIVLERRNRESMPLTRLA